MHDVLHVVNRRKCTQLYVGRNTKYVENKINCEFNHKLQFCVMLVFLFIFLFLFLGVVFWRVGGIFFCLFL
jgi:predicted RND superfamily exporter protein